MRYKNFNELISNIKSRTKLSVCAIVGANDKQTLEAALMAYHDRIIIPYFIGNRPTIIRQLLEMGEDPDNFYIDDQSTLEKCAQEAVALANAGKVDFIMKGQIETGLLMHVILSKESDMRTGQLVSALSVMETPFYHKLLFLSDAGICMYPDLEQKKCIIENAVEAMTKMGIDTPKIAALCAIEYLNPKMPETVDAAKLKEMNLNGEISNCIIEGPISYDVAMYRECAEQKGFISEVAGDPDMLLWPDITCGNIAAKIMDHSAGGSGGGLVIGTKVPIILTSRGDDSEGKYRCIVLGAAYNN